MILKEKSVNFHLEGQLKIKKEYSKQTNNQTQNT